MIAFDAQNRPLKTGTGFFITADGVAVTNYHVIQGASSLTAMTNDGAFFAFVSVLYAPKGVDLAILKFAAHDAHWLKLGRSDTAVEGQRGLVIGNPNGLQGDCIRRSNRGVSGRSLLNPNKGSNFAGIERFTRTG